VPSTTLRPHVSRSVLAVTGVLLVLPLAEGPLPHQKGRCAPPLLHSSLIEGCDVPHRRTRITREDLSEAIVSETHSTRNRIRLHEEITKFGRRSSAEGLLSAGNVGATELPGARSIAAARRVEWVEFGALGRINAARAWAGVRGIGDVALAGRIGVSLDAPQIRLKRDPIVIFRGLST
jgi:hypothetical protein